MTHDDLRRRAAALRERRRKLLRALGLAHESQLATLRPADDEARARAVELADVVRQLAETYATKRALPRAGPQTAHHTLRLPLALDARVREAATSKGLTITEVLVQAIQEGLAAHYREQT